MARRWLLPGFTRWSASNGQSMTADEVRLGSAVLLVVSVSSVGLQTLRIDEPGDGEDGTVWERRGDGAGMARTATTALRGSGARTATTGVAAWGESGEGWARERREDRDKEGGRRV